MSNRITVVNDHDEIIGYKARKTLAKEEIYRVAALWITNSHGDILLAQRKFTKTHDPGKWGPAVAGTVDEGETYDSNITKETEEEIGLKNAKPAKGPKRRVSGKFNYFCQWYTLQIDKPAEDFTPQQEEVEAVKWVGAEELKKEVQQHPEHYLDGLAWPLKMLSKEAAIPTDSRYVPFTQQPYCCVPSSLQIVMHKLGLPLVAQEELGYNLGLTVPPEYGEQFWHVRVSEEPPTAAGYGTQINRPEYNPNQAFKMLGIPLKFTYNLIDNFKTIEEVRAYLQKVEKTNADTIVCFRYGSLYDTDESGGHASVFDRYLPDTDEVRLVDPGPRVPKWRIVPLAKFFSAMKEHGPEKSGGFWEVEKA